MLFDMYACAEKLKARERDWAENARRFMPNRLLKSTLPMPEMTEDERIVMKIGNRWDYLWVLDVSHPELELWLKEGCHPKYHNFKKLPLSHPVKARPRDNLHHPLSPPDDISEWIWETPTRLVEKWYAERYRLKDYAQRIKKE